MEIGRNVVIVVFSTSHPYMDASEDRGYDSWKCGKAFPCFRLVACGGDNYSIIYLISLERSFTCLQWYKHFCMFWVSHQITDLTHWGRVTHICVGNLTIIGSDNGLSPGRHQAIIGTNAGILLIRPLGTNFSENFIEILTFSFTKMWLKVSSAKWRPFCLGLNVLILICILTDNIHC